METGSIIGQIFYSHGLAVITTSSLVDIGIEVSESTANLENTTINFVSSWKIYEHQYNCPIRENEFGYSLNPTLLSGSDSIYYDFATGSEFVPYITTVGLYNDKQELLATGKLSKPIPISNKIDTNILINFDI